MEAPPKQLASALDGLGRAIRLIADVRSGADALLEALDSADSVRRHDGERASQPVASAVEAAKHGMDLLRSTAKELEAAGVFVGAQQRYADNQPWGLHMPVVCPDGALVAYSWKRQIAGQAAASAVDRTKLALKSFSEQKKRVLPHLHSPHPAKRSKPSDEQQAQPSLSDLVKRSQDDAPGMTITPHSRLSSPPPAFDNAALLLIELPGVLRAVISLLPVGTPNPDAIAIYSPSELQMDAWGVSTHDTFQRISECAADALHHFTRYSSVSSLELLMRWLSSYRSLFTKTCKHCRRLFAPDPVSNLLMPPTHRAHTGHEEYDAYHPGCVSS